MGVLILGVIYFAVTKLFPATKAAISNFALWELHLCAFLLPLAASIIITWRYAKE